MIQVFKIFNGFEKVELCNTPIFKSNLSTRGHSQRYAREICINNARYNFLTNRIAKEWNELPLEVLFSKTVNEFKANLDKRMNGL